MSTHLDQYIDSVADVPHELKRLFGTIRELDKTATHLSHEIDNLQGEHVEAVKAKVTQAPSGTDLSAFAEDREKIQKIEEKRAELVSLSDEKVRVSELACDLVAKHMEALDNTLHTFEQELRSQGEYDESQRYSHMANHPSQAMNGAALDMHGALEQEVDYARPPPAKRKAAADSIRHTVDDYAAAAASVPAPEAAAAAAGAEGEEVYCFCRRVSFGDMVGCDNEQCPYEWFHFECVGLHEQPEGEWYCPECRTKLNIDH